MSNRISLTQGKFAIVNDANFEWLNQWKWRYHSAGYAVRGGPRPAQRTIYMHRVILNSLPGIETDHINGDRLDNHRCNLRSCTHSQNLCNATKPSHRRGKQCSSKYKGVSWNKFARKWAARVQGKKGSGHLGYFVNEDDAARAYNTAAHEAFGEFAKPNIIEHERHIDAGKRG